MLDYEPGTFQSCFMCDKSWREGYHTISQAPGSSRPINRDLASSGLLAHVSVIKYAGHTPLYRQRQIYPEKALSCNAPILLIEWVRRHACEPLSNWPNVDDGHR